MPIAAIAFDFDPLLHLGDALVVRWSTLALAAVLLAVLGTGAFLARGRGDRADDVLSLAVGAVPGAVVGGRLGYLIVHPEAFAAGPATLLDPSVGGLELVGGVVGGVVTANYVAGLLGAPVGRWAQRAAPLVLVAIGGGKLAMLLAASGQGLPSDAAWATAYVGPGPWGSLAPDLPSHPSAAYEGFAALAIAAVFAVLAGGAGDEGVARAPAGRLLLVAIAAWCLARAAISLTWRDPVAIGPLPAGGALALVVAVLAIALALVLTARAPARASGRGRGAGEDPDDPAWPDPATRPPF